MVIIVAIAVAAGAVYYFGTRDVVAPLEPKVDDVVVNATSTVVTSDWKTYINEKHGFEIKYLPNWLIKEDDNNIVRIVNPDKQGKPDTDLPIEQLVIKKTGSACVNSDWEQGFGLVFYKTICMGPKNDISITMTAGDNIAKSIMSQIISTLKFTSQTSVDQNLLEVNKLISCAITKYNYTIKYPSNYRVMEVISGGYAPSSCEKANTVATLTLVNENKKQEFSIETRDKSRLDQTVVKGCNSVESCTSYIPNLVSNLLGRVSAIGGEKVLWSLNDKRWFYVYHNGIMYHFYAANFTDNEINDLLNNFKFTSTSNTQPSITVLSPNGGEVWKMGSKQVIGWKPIQGKIVDIKIESKENCVLEPCLAPPAPGTNMPTTSFSPIIAKAVSNSGIFEWTVGQYSLGGNSQTIPKAGLYKITICPNVFDESRVRSSNPCDVSDNYFTITN
jgi:hypothetical protein